MSDESARWFEAHSEEKVEEAIRGLRSIDHARLLSFARDVLGGHGIDGRGRSHDDLLAEALLRTLDGSRSWKKGVDFVFHLRQVMKSVLASWRKSQEREQKYAIVVRSLDLKDERNRDDDKFEGDPIENLASPDEYEDVATRLANREEHEGEIEPIFRHFEGDTLASEVLAGWERGLDGPEIQRRSGMTLKEYRAAVRRIRRHARKEERRAKRT